MWGVGVSAVLDAEWFVTENISLIGEYGSSFVYSSTNRKSKSEHRMSSDSNYEVVNDDEIDSTKFSFGYDTVKFGLSVYFN